MLLRDHPLMSYRDVRNWPPAWIWTHGRERVSLRGEIGTLIDVRRSAISTNSLFLHMQHHCCPDVEQSESANWLI